MRHSQSSTRNVSLAAHVKLPLQFPLDNDNQDSGGVANSNCLHSCDCDGDNNIELIIGLLSGKICIYKTLQQTTPWATSAPILGSIVTVASGFFTRPHPTFLRQSTKDDDISMKHPQLIVVSAEGACYLFDLYQCNGGYGALKPLACYQISPSVQTALVVHTREAYDDLCIATTEKSLHLYGMITNFTPNTIGKSQEDWGEIEKWNIDEGAVSSISAISNNPNHILLGLQTGNVLIVDLSSKTHSKANSRFKSFPSSMPKRRAARIVARQRERQKQLKFRHLARVGVKNNRNYVNNNREVRNEVVENGIDSGNVNVGSLNQLDNTDDTPMSLMMQMQQNRAEQRMQAEMDMETSGAQLGGSLSSVQMMGFRGSLGASSPTNISSLELNSSMTTSSNISSDNGKSSSNSSSSSSSYGNSSSSNSNSIVPTTKQMSTSNNIVKNSGKTSDSKISSSYLSKERNENDMENSFNNSTSSGGTGTASIETWTTVNGCLSGWGDFPNKDVECIEKAENDQEAISVKQTSDNKKNMKPLFVSGTLEGDISIWNAASNQLCWYETVGANHGQIFALQSIDITGDGVDELIACAWDGTTYIFDQKCDCAVYDFDENVLAFLACNLTVSASNPASKLVNDSTALNANSSNNNRSDAYSSIGQYEGAQPCLLYATNDAVTVFVMGSSSSSNNSNNSNSNSNSTTKLSTQEKLPPSLELLGSTSIASKTAVIHDPGRPICYVRPPSLEEELRYRDKDLPERAFELVLRSLENNDLRGSGTGNEKLLHDFIQCCLYHSVDNDPIDVLRAFRDELRNRMNEVMKSDEVL
jgi:hypothetical protein